MIRGLYIAATGMVAETARQDVIANNLANVNSNGYKRDAHSTTRFAEMLVSNFGVPGAPEVGALTLGSQVGQISTIATQGSLRSTGNTFDIALTGEGWITVDAAAGRRYTRDGQMQIDGQGRLRAADGSPVASVSGRPIVVDPNAGTVSIEPDGTVTQGGQDKGRIRIASLDPATLRKEGSNLVLGTEAGTATASVKQGFLESSNVNTVTEMVQLIEVMRTFEANQKAFLAHGDALQDAVNKVGVVG